jgi:hypothetical protein
MARLGKRHEVAQRLDIDHDALTGKDNAKKVLSSTKNSIGLYRR